MSYTLTFTNTFRKGYKKLPAKIQAKTQTVIRLMSENPFHPELQFKKMVNTPNIYELRLDRSFRLTYTASDQTVLLRVIGSHDVLKKP
ncbi:MAG: hypothetical protein ACOYL5_19410 [Phototrophicaceae bacterium]|jgi:mRNA-degrading endonuclease RelE of RelBE toxin-antitoxin system